MSRTLSGNLTGEAAHGRDDIYDEPSDYAKRLTIASAKVKELMGNDAAFIRLMVGLLDGEMLETFESIIEQCAEWDEAHPCGEFKADSEADELADVARWLDSEPIRKTADNVEVRANPVLNAGARYDFTPIPSDMPIIDMDTIEEIEL